MEKSINYSDGNVEKYIEELIKDASDLSSYTNIAKEEYNHWPIRYHLSSVRSNAIKHLNFDGLDVLELGAGMGAMSRYIAEKCNHLTVVEGTVQRMNCLKQRLRDLNNWEGVVANYQDFNTDKKYDVVCFLGVLEYAGRYIEAKNPFEWAINHAKSFLKENGLLVILIENKNGLKYFAGLSEDHYGKPFYGICGYPIKDDIKTFSKKEMLEMLYKEGFEETVVHHLAPDYKCTRAVLTDDFLKEYPLVAADILSSYKTEDYGINAKEIFPTILANVSLAKSGLLSEVSNSYLFIANLKKDSEIKKHFLKETEEEKKKVFLYTYGRKKEVVTKFIQKNDNYVVCKEFLLKDKQTENEKAVIENNFCEEQLFDGLSMSYFITNHLYYGNHEKLIDLISDYFSFVFEKYRTDNNDVLQPCIFDANFKNVKIKDGKYYIFDNEYNLTFDLTKSYFIFRFVLYFNEIRKISEKPLFNTLNEMYEYFCNKFNVEKKVNEDIKKEAKIQETIACLDYEKNIKYIKSLFFDNPKEKKIKFLGIPVGKKIRDKNKRKIKIFGVSFSYKKKK